MRLVTLTTSPPPSPTLAETKAHLRIEGTDLDGALAPLIGAAVTFVEDETRTALGTTAYRLYLDRFPDAREITLLRPPLQAVQAVRYVAGGAEQTLDPAVYTPDPSGSRPGRVCLNGGREWPATDDVPNAVRIDFTAGHGADVPATLKFGVMALAGHFLDHPEAVVDRRLDEVPLGLRSIILHHAMPEVF